MHNSQTYRLCFISSTFKETPTFKVKLPQKEQVVRPYFVPAQKQFYNYDLLIQRNKKSKLIIDCYINESLKGSAQLAFGDGSQLQKKQQSKVWEGKEQVGVIYYTLGRIQKKLNPALTISVIQASYLEDKDSFGKMDAYIVLKYGDLNYKTKVAQGQGTTPVWKETFRSEQSFHDRLILQSWEQDLTTSEFLGQTVIELATNIGTQANHDVLMDGTKVGNLKVGIYKKGDGVEEKQERKGKKRKIKLYAVDAILQFQLKKRGFLRLIIGDQQFETTPVFAEKSQLLWNQAFTVEADGWEQQLSVYLCVKDTIEQQIAMAVFDIAKVENKKYQIALMENQSKVGKLYLEFYDQELDIRENISSYREKQDLREYEAREDPQPKAQNIKKVSGDTVQKIKESTNQIKNKYSSRQTISEYMGGLNEVLQEGLLKLARDRPADPIKELGLFLINYQK